MTSAVRCWRARDRFTSTKSRSSITSPRGLAEFRAALLVGEGATGELLDVGAGGD